MGRIFVLTSLVLFMLIGVAALFKTKKVSEEPIVINQPQQISTPLAIALYDSEPEVIEPAIPTSEEKRRKLEEPVTSSWPLSSDNLPHVDRIDYLFTTDDRKFPFVQNISYKSRVSWLKGRPAWISDYASHFKTSRHFIARSLNGKGNYYKQDVSNNDSFTVLNPDKEIEFYLLIDLSRARLWLYAYDKDVHKRYLIKDYPVGLGRPDPLKSSGLLTPRGKYLLGERVAAYKPGVMGYHNGKKIEMIRTFGTRWIPFEKEISKTTAPAKGYGIHGVPWSEESTNGKLVEDIASLGTYTSDGCVRLKSDDIEEIYAIIVSRPSYIEMVSDFSVAELPGEEVR